MKFIKYIAAALLLTATLASCETGGVESGTPGNTTVQFASAEVESGFGAGVVYVPLTIVSDTEEGMNSCNVQAKLKVVTTGEQYEGAHDTDGLSGDYRITSLDMNFPAYGSYYDEEEPEKYKDPETGKWVKQVNVEVFIINSDPDVMCFTLEIESATTTIGDNKQCKVTLEKSTRDRMCGLFTVKYDKRFWIDDNANYFDGSEYESYFPTDASKYAFSMAEIGWVEDGYFYLYSDHHLSGVFGATMYAYYDEGATDEDEGDEKFFMYNFDFIGTWDEAGTQWIIVAIWDTEKQAWAEDEIINWEFNVEEGTLTLPAKYAISLGMFSDQFGNGFIAEITPAFSGVVLTKMQ